MYMSFRRNAGLCRLTWFLGVSVCIVSILRWAVNAQTRTAWWRGEWDTSDSAGSHPGQLVEAASFVTGKVGMAFNFRAPNDGVWVRSGGTLDLASGPGLTIIAWIYPTGLIGIYPIFEWGSDSLSEPELNFSISGPTPSGIPTHSLYVKLSASESAPVFYTSANLIKSNQWQQVAFLWDRASGNIKLFRNGSVVLDSSTTFKPVTTDNIQIGFRPGLSLGFNGAMDEISLFDHALSANEVRGLFLADAPAMLNIRPSIPGHATLVWSSQYWDHAPQRAPTLPGPWEPLQSTPTLVGSEYWADETASESQGFFRLVQR